MNKKIINLVTLPNKVLRQKSKNIPIPLTDEDIELAEAMIYHIDDSQKPGTKFRPGVGVAAVQYGILKNMFYINNLDMNLKGSKIRDVFINPKIIATSDAEVALSQGEGCLSVKDNYPNQAGYVYRKSRIVFEAYSYFQKKWIKVDLTGYGAIIAQHELDHLSGKLFIDHINKKLPWRKKQGDIIDEA